MLLSLVVKEISFHSIEATRGNSKIEAATKGNSKIEAATKGNSKIEVTRAYSKIEVSESKVPFVKFLLLEFNSCSESINKVILYRIITLIEISRKIHLLTDFLEKEPRGKDLTLNASKLHQFGHLKSF